MLISVSFDVTPKDATVVDSWVGKYEGTVSWFSPGSYASRPPLEGAGNDILPNIKCAGDWVRMGVKEHGAKGLCQGNAFCQLHFNLKNSRSKLFLYSLERAFVTGLEAANSLLKVTTNNSSIHEVIPVRKDEEQFELGVNINKEVMKVLPRFWVR